MAELVTGHNGASHVTAEQAARLNAGILGLDDYVLNMHDKFKITVVSANRVTIGTGELVMQGRHVSQGAPEDLIITNGSQGQKRNDLIVCRYTKGSQSIESAQLLVVKGTPTTGTPTDPALNTTSPLDGGTTYDMPLYRIPLDGITIGTPVALFNVLKPMAVMWDSLAPIHFVKLVTDPEFMIRGFVVNGLATVYCRWVNKGSFFTRAWSGVALASMDVQAVDESYNRFVDNSYEGEGQNRFLYVAGNTVFFRASYDETVPENVWHAGSVSFPVATV